MRITERTAEARAKAEAQMQAEWNNTPIPATRLIGEIRNAAPKDAVYVGAGGTSGRAPFAQLMDLPYPNSFFEGGASLGFPLPGTMGVKLALPDRPVIGLLREGDSMCSIQGLWTAAKYNINVTWIVFNNAQYRILKLGMVKYLGETPRKSEFMGMDFGDPAIDISKQAAVWGIHNQKVTDPADLGPALKAGLAHNGPSMIDVTIDNSYRAEPPLRTARRPHGGGRSLCPRGRRPSRIAADGGSGRPRCVVGRHWWGRQPGGAAAGSPWRSCPHRGAPTALGRLPHRGRTVRRVRGGARCRWSWRRGGGCPRRAAEGRR